MMETVKQTKQSDDLDLLLQQSIKLSSKSDDYYEGIPTGVEVEVIEDYSCVVIGEDGNWCWKRP